MRTPLFSRYSDAHEENPTATLDPFLTKAEPMTIDPPRGSAEEVWLMECSNNNDGTLTVLKPSLRCQYGHLKLTNGKCGHGDKGNYGDLRYNHGKRKWEKKAE